MTNKNKLLLTQRKQDKKFSVSDHRSQNIIDEKQLFNMKRGHLRQKLFHHNTCQKIFCNFLY